MSVIFNQLWDLISNECSLLEDDSALSQTDGDLMTHTRRKTQQVKDIEPRTPDAASREVRGMIFDASFAREDMKFNIVDAMADADLASCTLCRLERLESVYN
jgi:hypothetical protein